ncbi:MAG TPA: TraI domain-containing protein [Planctomycetota bacterium]|jgi:hypothetical protein|nr:TraI domain-containing protein [Planctomycetota bacterium]
MFKQLERLMGLGARSADSEALETFGEVRISRQRGMETLRATPERRTHLQGIRDLLPSMTREEKDELVDRVAARVALFVFDLPASKSNHHSGRFGLLDHLLEVAHLSARELSSPGFQISPEPSINHRERPMWVYAGVVAALAHDLGKPLDLDVLAPGTTTAWDPKAEPLRLFCQSHHLEETGPALWTFHRGRGLHGHERRLEEILPFVLPPSVAAYLGPRLEAVIHALSSGKDLATAPDLPWAACEVVRVVWRMDQTSARADSKGRGLLEEPEALESQATESSLLPVEPPPRISGPAAPEGARTDLEVSEAGSGDSSALETPTPPPEPPPSRPVPADFWRESVPGPRRRPGDPEENRRKLAAELDPPRFLSTIRRMIVSCRLSRNNLYTEVYIRPDYVWLMVPRALRRIALINHLPFDREVLEQMFRSLGSSPQVEPWSREEVPLFIKARMDSSTQLAIRLKTAGFLSEEELAMLGVYPVEIRIMDPLGSASLPGKKP